MKKLEKYIFIGPLWFGSRPKIGNRITQKPVSLLRTGNQIDISENRTKLVGPIRSRFEQSILLTPNN